MVTKACEASDWEDASFIDTLAAAYAEQGEFEAAVKYANQAVELAKGDKKDQYKQRLALFEAGKPYRSKTGKSAESQR
jgi:hypothetical protein